MYRKDEPTELLDESRGSPKRTGSTREDLMPMLMLMLMPMLMLMLMLLLVLMLMPNDVDVDADSSSSAYSSGARWASRHQQRNGRGIAWTPQGNCLATTWQLRWATRHQHRKLKCTCILYHTILH